VFSNFENYILSKEKCLQQKTGKPLKKSSFFCPKKRAQGHFFLDSHFGHLFFFFVSLPFSNLLKDQQMVLAIEFEMQSIRTDLEYQLTR